MLISNSEERYLLCIYKQQIEVCNAVSTNFLAENLGVKAASVTEMLNKLHDKGFVSYIRSKGATITSSGKMLALQVLRKQLLWELLLMNKMNLGREEAVSVSFFTRHIDSQELVKKLSSFLGNPLYGVNGEPIPKEDGNMDHAFGIVLHTAPIGFKGKIVGFKDTNPAFLDYLNRKNIYVGVIIDVLDICIFDQSLEVLVNGMSNSINISRKIAENIIVA